jgi:hypothetical protein
MRSIYSAIKISFFQVYYKQIPYYNYINIFGSIIYYNNPEERKKLQDETIYSILIGYKDNTIYYILKLDGRITCNIIIKTIKQIL